MKLSRKAMIGIALLASLCLSVAETLQAAYAFPISNYRLSPQAQPQDADVKMLIQRLEKCGVVVSDSVEGVNTHIRALSCVGFEDTQVVLLNNIDFSLRGNPSLRKAWHQDLSPWARAFAALAELPRLPNAWGIASANLEPMLHAKDPQQRVLALLKLDDSPQAQLIFNQALNDSAWVPPYSATVADFALFRLWTVPLRTRATVDALSIQFRPKLNAYRGLRAAAPYRAPWLSQDPNWQAAANPVSTAALAGLWHLATRAQLQLNLTHPETLRRMVAFDALVERVGTANPMAAVMTLARQKGDWTAPSDVPVPRRIANWAFDAAVPLSSRWQIERFLLDAEREFSPCDARKYKSAAASYSFHLYDPISVKTHALTLQRQRLAMRDNSKCNRPSIAERAELQRSWQAMYPKDAQLLTMQDIADSAHRMGMAHPQPQKWLTEVLDETSPTALRHLEPLFSPTTPENVRTIELQALTALSYQNWIAPELLHCLWTVYGFPAPKAINIWLDASAQPEKQALELLQNPRLMQQLEAPPANPDAPQICFARVAVLLAAFEHLSPATLDRELAKRLPHAHPCELEAYFEAAKLLPIASAQRATILLMRNQSS